MLFQIYSCSQIFYSSTVTLFKIRYRTIFCLKHYALTNAPINNAKAIKDRLIRGEKILHPYIGIQMLTLTPDVARQLNRDPNADIFIPEVEGVLIISIMPNSPAQVAGLSRGDVITAIDDIAIADADRLQDIIDRSSIDRPMTIDIYRGKKTKQLSVTPQAIESLDFLALHLCGMI